MENPLKKLNLDPVEIQRKQVEKAEKERFESIADQIIGILIRENTLTNELPRVFSAVTGKINAKIDNSLIDKILNL